MVECVCVCYCSNGEWKWTAAAPVWVFPPLSHMYKDLLYLCLIFTFVVSHIFSFFTINRFVVLKLNLFIFSPKEKISNHFSSSFIHMWPFMLYSKANSGQSDSIWNESILSPCVWISGREWDSVMTDMSVWNWCAGSFCATSLIQPHVV